jgi:uncharacterized membrane protein (UPF0182 family)
MPRRIIFKMKKIVLITLCSIIFLSAIINSIHNQVFLIKKYKVLEAEYLKQSIEITRINFYISELNSER